MARKPTGAVLCSLAGGILTLISALVMINSWFALQSTLGAGFAYSSLGLGDIQSGEAIIFFVIGASCGVLIIGGALSMNSGGTNRVRRASALVLIATLVGIPTTFFGMVLGGVLSIVGAGLGLSWKPSEKIVRPGDNSNPR